MSSLSAGNDSWMWLTFLRLAEPLIKRVDGVIASDVAETRVRTLGPIADEPANVMDYEDAERWDGLS